MDAKNPIMLADEVAHAYKFDEENHHHSLDGKPLIGVSTACGSLGKGGLTWWASGMACGEMGWWHPREAKSDRVIAAFTALEEIKKMDAEDYLKKLDRAYRAHDSHKNKAATKGTGLHDFLEKWVKWHIKPSGECPALPDNCQPWVRWCAENVDRFLASEVHGYSTETWTGGIFDVLWLGKDGKKYLGDFKSSKSDYFAHYVQGAGYALQLAQNGGFDANGKRYGNPQMVDGIAVIPFGADDPTPRIRGDVAEHIEAFRALITVYKLEQSHKKEN